MSRRPFTSRWWIACALAAGLTVPASAQTRTDSVSTSANALSRPLNTATLLKASYESLFTVRPAAEIQADLLAARDAEIHAADDRERVRASSSTAKSNIEVLEREKDSVSQRVDIAKKGNLAVEKITLETQKKSLELQIKVLERDAELKKTHAEVAKKQIEEAQARQKMYQLELEFAAKHSELERFVADASRSGVLVAESLVRLHRDTRELERKVLEATKDHTDKAIAAAHAKKSYVEKQIDLLKAKAEALAINE